MNGFLPLMNYGDQIAKEDSAPLGGGQAGMGVYGYAAPGNQQTANLMPTGGITAQPIVGSSVPPVILPNAMPNAMPNGNYSPCSCNGKKESPFENETVQYALLFALLYVVIKKL